MYIYIYIERERYYICVYTCIYVPARHDIVREDLVVVAAAARKAEVSDPWVAPLV